MKPRLLDLFCGAGGATKGYQDAGFYVIGVDIKPQPRYCGDEFIHADALDVLRGEWEPLPSLPPRSLATWIDDWDEANLARSDSIHASPPCQRWAGSTGDYRDNHPDLITPLRPLLEATGLPYVIENVPGAPLRNPVQLCGSSFGLPLRRHRLFESNFPIMAAGCAHGQMPDRFDVYEHGHWYKSPFAKVYGTGGGKAGEHWDEAMGIDWMTRDELREAIPPVYTTHVGEFLMTHLQTASKAA